MISALDISKHILHRCNKNGRRITNLQLQKILYFVWCDYYGKTKTHLFEDKFLAWKLGPIVLNAYIEYCAFGYLDIFYPDDKLPEDVVSPEIASLIDSSIDNFSSMSASKLVNMSHEKGSPWDIVFDNGKGHNQVIPFSLIEKSVLR